MTKQDIKSLLMKVGPLALGALAFIASSIADTINQKNEEEYIDERVREEVERRLSEHTGEEDETVEDTENEEDEESEIETEEP